MKTMLTKRAKKLLHRVSRQADEYISTVFLFRVLSEHFTNLTSEKEVYCSIAFV